MGDQFVATFAIFCSIALPMGLIIAIAACKSALQHKQIDLIMAERRALIERGATDLPPLVFPSSTAVRHERLFNLRAGMIFVAVSAGLLIPALLIRGEPLAAAAGGVDVRFAIVLGLIGVALIVFHFIAARYPSEEAPCTRQSELPAEVADGSAAAAEQPKG